MERISTHQFMVLGAAVLMGTSFLPLATLVIKIGGRDGWMSVMPGFALGIPCGLMIISLLEQYPGQNLLQISSTIFGKWLSKVIGVIYILITGYYGGLLLGTVGDTFTRSIMPLTPLWVFYLGALVLVFFLVSCGIEVFARFAEVIFPLIVIALFLNIVLSVPRVEQGELLPFLEDGLKPPLIGVLKVMPFPMEYGLFLAGLLSFLPSKKQEIAQLKTGVWRAVFLVGILDMLVVIVQVLVFGPEETNRLIYGLLELGKMVEVSRTFSGVESLFMGVWLGASVIKISAFFFMVLWGLETIFNLKGSKWRIIVSFVFLGIALGNDRGHSLMLEAFLVEGYLILPFASVWIITSWGVTRWKKRAGGQ